MKGMMAAIVAASMLLGGVLQGGETKRYTADYYRAMSHKFEGTVIRLYITHLEPRSTADAIQTIDGIEYKLFQACTANGDTAGGWIEVAIPLKKVERTVKKYGLDPASRGNAYAVKTLRGTLTKAVSKGGDPIYYVIMQSR